MNAKEILQYLEERRLVTACVEWCRSQGLQYADFHRNVLYRSAKRDDKKEPYTTRQRFLLNIAQKFVEIKKESEAQAA